MICYTCGHCSMHKACPYCGAKDIRSVVGFDPIDLFNPIGLGQKIATSQGLPNPLGIGDSSSSSSSDGPSLWDRLPSIPNPFSTAYDTGKSIGTTVTSTIKQPLDQISSFMSVLKWVVIGGAVVGAIVLLYGVIKFVPVALGIAGETTRETTKMIPHLVKASL